MVSECASVHEAHLCSVGYLFKRQTLRERSCILVRLPVFIKLLLQV